MSLARANHVEEGGSDKMLDDEQSNTSDNLFVLSSSDDGVFTLDSLPNSVSVEESMDSFEISDKSLLIMTGILKYISFMLVFPFSLLLYITCLSVTIQIPDLKEIPFDSNKRTERG